MRPIEIFTDLLPNAHGSTLFTRGETQSLATATLGSKVFHYCSCRLSLIAVLFTHAVNMVQSFLSFL